MYCDIQEVLDVYHLKNIEASVNVIHCSSVSFRQSYIERTQIWLRKCIEENYTIKYIQENAYNKIDSWL